MIASGPTRWLLRCLGLLLLLTTGLGWLIDIVRVKSAAPASDSAPGEWRRSNPGGGGAFAAVGAGPTGIILAASDRAGAYRSLDQGQTWEIIGATAGLSTSHVSSVGFDPQEGAILYLGTDQGIFRSQDAGKSVQQVLDTGDVTALQFAPSDPNRGYAAWHSTVSTSDGKVYSSMDRGKIWQLVSTNLPTQLRILKLLISPNTANTLYLLAGEAHLACSPAELYRSTDGGVSWTQLAKELGQVQDFALDPHSADTLFVTTYSDIWDDNYRCIHDDAQGGNLFRSNNGGVTWSQLAQRTGAIWLDSNAAGAIRLIEPDHQLSGDSRNGIWESTDNGATWSQISSPAAWDGGWALLPDAYHASFEGVAHTFGEDLSDPDALFWVTPQFIFATRDDGRSFQNLYTRQAPVGYWQSRGIDNASLFDIAIGPARMSTTSLLSRSQIYLGYHDIGCWRSDDTGTSWASCSYATSNNISNDTLTLLTDPDRAGVVWSGQAQGLDNPFLLVRSVDGGQEWSSANTGLSGGPLMGLSLDRNSPIIQRTLFVTSGGDVYTSNNDGATWSKRFDCNGCRYTAVDHFDRTIVYAGGEQGLWRSQKSGEVGSWHRVGLAEMSGMANTNPFDAQWQGISAIVADPLQPHGLYVVVFGPGRGLYRSQDGGGTWQKLLTNSYLRRVALSPVDSEQIYVTAASTLAADGYPDAGGVWRSVDGGQAWSQVNDGLAWPLAAAIAIDPAQPNRLWIGTFGAGAHWRDFAAEIMPTPVPSVVATLEVTAPAAMPTFTPAVKTPQPSISGIAGRVTDEQDLPLVGVRVTAYRLMNGDWRKVGKTFTDGEGHYQFENLTVAPHRIRFSVDTIDGREAYGKEYFNNSRWLAQAHDVSVVAGEITRHVDVQLARTMTQTAEIVGDMAYHVAPDSGELAIVAWLGSQFRVERGAACNTEAEVVSNVKLLVGERTFAMQVVEGQTKRYQVDLAVPDDLPVSKRFKIAMQWRCNKPPRLAAKTLDADIGLIQTIDTEPSGQIIDGASGAPVAGAVVTLHYVPGWRPRTSAADQADNTCESVSSKPPTAPWSQTATEDLGEEVEPEADTVAINPQITGQQGYSLWPVGSGCWYLLATARGYVAGLSPVVGIESGLLDVGVVLTPERMVYLPLVAR